MPAHVEQRENAAVEEFAPLLVVHSHVGRAVAIPRVVEDRGEMIDHGEWRGWSGGRRHGGVELL